MTRDEYKQLATEADILHEEFNASFARTTPDRAAPRRLAQDLMNRDERDGDGHALVVQGPQARGHGWRGHNRRERAPRERLNAGPPPFRESGAFSSYLTDMSLRAAWERNAIAWAQWARATMHDSTGASTATNFSRSCRRRGGSRSTSAAARVASRAT